MNCTFLIRAKKRTVSKANVMIRCGMCQITMQVNKPNLKKEENAVHYIMVTVYSVSFKILKRNFDT